jgi:hypothetical protein
MPLKVSDGIGAWIKDFQKSDAPQFKGKSEKERRDQAIAAYLSAKRGDQKEDVDEKTVGYKSDSKLPNLKVPIKRRQGKILNRKTGKFEEVDEAKRVVHSDRPDSLKSLRVMHPKPSGSKPPFEGPYRKAGEVKKDKYGNVVKNVPRHLARKAARKVAGINEETNFQVNIEGLPMMFMSGMGQGEIMQKLRKIVKQPSMIQSVKRVTDADVKKTFRLKAQGRDEEEQVDEALKHTHAVVDPNGKVAGMSSDEKGAKDIARRHNGRVVRLKKPISSKRGDMMINRPFSEAKLDELSPATMNRYKKAAANSTYHASQKYARIAQTGGLSKKYKDKELAAADKVRNKRLSGLNRAARITGTHGQQDESK